MTPFNKRPRRQTPPLSSPHAPAVSPLCEATIDWETVPNHSAVLRQPLGAAKKNRRAQHNALLLHEVHQKDQ